MDPAMEEPAREEASLFPLGVTVTVPIKEAAPPLFAPGTELDIPIEGPPPEPFIPIKAAIFMKSTDPPAPPNNCAPWATKPTRGVVQNKRMNDKIETRFLMKIATIKALRDSRCVAAITSGSTCSILWLSFWVLARQLMNVFSTSSVSWR